ncbi:MAG: DUF6434 domain-containing protein [Cyanobacteria bacterium J06635_11]
MSEQEERPAIESIESGEEFKRWYWLKEELVSYCRTLGLGTAGQKQVLTARIVTFLDTGKIVRPVSKKVTSTFDWSKETLTLGTRTTDSYRNSQNVRKFMKQQVGDRFAFSNEFMEWMRDNMGKTLADAVEFWIDLDSRKRLSGYREKPLPQNQYNQFVRALSQAKPGISNKEIRRLWAVKRAKPGPHIYQPGDEDF